MKFFKTADKNHDGMISYSELEDICGSSDIEFDYKGFLDVVDVNKDR